MSTIDAIKKFVIDEFLPDVGAHELDNDHDLLADGVIDSLGVLKLIAWLESDFDLVVSDVELDPDNFRSVNAIADFIGRMGSQAKTGAPR